jgi:diguanylate cyclase (GGDEF)-like protein
MGIVSWGALAERRAVRSRQTSLMVTVVMAVVCALLAVKREFLPTPAAFGPLDWLYPVLFVGMGSLCLLFAALLRWTRWRWVPLVATLCLMAFAVLLTWVDLHFGNDYMAYTIAIFSLGVVFSTTPVGYALILGGSAVVLTALTRMTLPDKAGDSGFLTNLIVLGLAYAGCVLLERQRRQADEMSVRLEDLNEQLKETSFRDELTGLYNRRFLVEFLTAKRALAVRQSIPLSVVLIDVDHFKKINDTLGHAVGDMVLQRLAQALGDGVREADLAARYGGEEFILVLPHTPVTTAVQACERILQTVRTLSFPGVPWKITFSAGVAALEGEEPMETLLERADRRLYEAKRTRNRVVSVGE